MKFSARSLLVSVFDIAAAAAAWWLAYLLRFNFEIPDQYAAGMLHAMLWVVPLQAVTFRLFGLYHGIWRFASLPDLFQIVKAIGCAMLLVPLGLYLFPSGFVVPRSVLVLDPLILLLMMGGSRFAYRAWREHRQYGALQAQGKPVLVLGAGEAAASLLRELGRSGDWRVVGLLDDNVKRHKRTLQGVRVLGGIDEIGHWAGELRAAHAIVAMPSASHQARRRVVDLCVRAGVKPMTVPAFDDLMSGKVTVSKVRNVEVEDLLGRDPVSIDAPALGELLGGRTVVVTGAGGSIGSELCRQIARFRPARLVAFEQGEFFLYRLAEEFERYFPEVDLVPVAGDVRDAARVQQVLRDFAPGVVFHAAAYKHVPLMEDRNAWEAVRCNVLGTLTVAGSVIAAGVPKFVLISTDKAVNPTNVMGATKRLAEMVCQALQADAAATTLSMVRFGNVLASAGSVIPKFQEQIARGGPVTVTDPKITRYFMSIPEAAQLVLQAGLMGGSRHAGGEIFVLDMGEPVLIADLARDMIRLSGLSEEDIQIEFTGLRPGEKLYEELLASDEQTLPTHHPKVRIAKARPAAEGDWLPRLRRWLEAGPPGDAAQIRQELARWVPEYQPAGRPELRAIEGGKAQAARAPAQSPALAQKEL